MGCRYERKDVFGINLLWGKEYKLQVYFRLPKALSEHLEGYLHYGKWESGEDQEWYSPPITQSRESIGKLVNGWNRKHLFDIAYNHSVGESS